MAAGVLIGAYHFARYDLDTGTNGAAAEAQWFWYVASLYIKTNGQYLMPMLDVESAETNQQNYLKTYTQTAMSQWVNAWCTDGLKPCGGAGHNGDAGDLFLQFVRQHVVQQFGHRNGYRG